MKVASQLTSTQVENPRLPMWAPHNHQGLNAEEVAETENQRQHEQDLVQRCCL